jgi:hypothetical protein
MIQPNPYKLVCPKCDYSKIVTPKSDVLISAIDLSICPKCNIRLEEKTITTKENKSWFKMNFGK